MQKSLRKTVESLIQKVSSMKTCEKPHSLITVECIKSKNSGPGYTRVTPGVKSFFHVTEQHSKGEVRMQEWTGIDRYYSDYTAYIYNLEEREKKAAELATFLAKQIKESDSSVNKLGI